MSTIELRGVDTSLVVYQEKLGFHILLSSSKIRRDNIFSSEPSHLHHIPVLIMSLLSTPKSVLVTGANGYIGSAVAHAFVRAGWTVYGLVRSPHHVPVLAAAEIIPIQGSAADPSFLPTLHAYTKTFDVIVSTTEQILDYLPHYNDTVSLLRALASTSGQQGVRPLVLFTSGCKDYGTTSLAGSPGLAPHTEVSPLRAPTLLAPRTKYAVQIFEHADLFDAAVLRPTNVYGYNSSYYGTWFDMASAASKKGIFELPADARTILHAMHVDDCGEAYVALAEHADRRAVAGQCFNISASQYNTLEEIAAGLVKEYGIEGGASFVAGEREMNSLDATGMLVGYSQWVGSEKLRALTGWTDRRQLFSLGLHAYRLAYEAAIVQREDATTKLEGIFSARKS